jgi:hypothetical protein
METKTMCWAHRLRWGVQQRDMVVLTNTFINTSLLFDIIKSINLADSARRQGYEGKVQFSIFTAPWIYYSK